MILHYSPCTDDNVHHPLLIINIDETNSLFSRGHDVWLKQLLVSIASVIVESRHFVFITLTGTHATDLFKSILTSGSGVRTKDVVLPLLNCDHAKEVILELANRGQVS